MRWWDRRLDRTKKGATMPTRRLSDYYSFRLFVSFILAVVLMFGILLALSPKSGANIPPAGAIIEDAAPTVPEETVPPTCQDFASEPQAHRVEAWRRLLFNGLAASPGVTREAIRCAIDNERVIAFDSLVEIGCQSGGDFQEVFLAEMNRHLHPCGFRTERNDQ